MMVLSYVILFKIINNFIEPKEIYGYVLSTFLFEYQYHNIVR